MECLLEIQFQQRIDLKTQPVLKNLTELVIL